MPVHAIIHPNMFLWLRLITHKKLTTDRRLDPGSKCEHARSRKSSADDGFFPGIAVLKNGTSCLASILRQQQPNFRYHLQSTRQVSFVFAGAVNLKCHTPKKVTTTYSTCTCWKISSLLNCKYHVYLTYFDKLTPCLTFKSYIYIYIYISTYIDILYILLHNPKRVKTRKEKKQNPAETCGTRALIVRRPRLSS